MDATPRRAMRVLPWLLLVAYGLAFAAVALGRRTPLLDDHPGQLARLWHVVRYGFAPWAWDPSWWTGYPELQFYPPAFFDLGALLHWISFAQLSVPAAYSVLVWIAYLAPGVATLFALARVQRSAWLALPGAFVALTLTLWPPLASGIEGAIHTGMAPARLAWALLPLLLGVLVPWAEGTERFPLRAVPLVALVVLMHPAHLPAAVVLVALAAAVRPPRTRRLALAVAALAGAAMLTAIWTLPLVARLAEMRALSWREASLGPPALAIAMALLSLRALLVARRTRSGAAWTTALFPWAMAVVVFIDAALLEPHGVQALPADRLTDSAWLALVMAACVGAGGIAAPSTRPPSKPEQVERGLTFALSFVVAALLYPMLALWPSPREWSERAEAVARLPMERLWATLRQAPAGRVFFVRSGMPLTGELPSWQPHTHITALTPVEGGRAIVNGTFTHPSPIAALVYRGDAGPGAITRLVEGGDGLALFGVRLESLDAATFEERLRRMRVSTVVALQDDVPRLKALEHSTAFPDRREVAPFVVWNGAAESLPEESGDGRWRVRTSAGAGEWASAGLAYYPLWHASAGGRSLETRRGDEGDLQVRARPGEAVELAYVPGLPERLGLALSVLAVAAWVALALRLRISDRPLRGAAKP